MIGKNGKRKEDKNGINRHERWINFTCKKAKESKITQYKHCAALVKANRLIKYGTNSNKSGALVDDTYSLCLFHAEVSVLFNNNIKKEDLKHMTLYVSGINKSGNIINSKPCSKCQNYLKKYRLKAIYYSLPNGEYAQYIT